MPEPIIYETKTFRTIIANGSTISFFREDNAPAFSFLADFYGEAGFVASLCHATKRSNLIIVPDAPVLPADMWDTTDELDVAQRDCALSYHGAVVGCDWDEALDHARFMADRCLREARGNVRVAAARLYADAYRYEEM